MESTNDLDDLLDEQEPYATFRDARLVAVSLDYRGNEAVTTWNLCVGDPDDSMRVARERRRTGRLILSGMVFWVMDPPKALDTRPGLPWLTEVAPLPEAPTETGQQLARLLPPGTSGWCFFFASSNAHVYCGARQLRYEWMSREGGER
jgi:hypothetical protein